MKHSLMQTFHDFRTLNLKVEVKVCITHYLDMVRGNFSVQNLNSSRDCRETILQKGA